MDKIWEVIQTVLILLGITFLAHLFERYGSPMGEMVAMHVTIFLGVVLAMVGFWLLIGVGGVIGALGVFFVVGGALLIRQTAFV